MMRKREGGECLSNVFIKSFIPKKLKINKRGGEKFELYDNGD
jgi:hypothetical protein